MKKLLAVLLALSILFAFAACGSKSAGNEETEPAPWETTDEAESTSAEAESTEAVTDESAPAETSEAAETSESASEESTSEEETTEAAKKPETTAEILAAYTEVMDQAKKDAPGFTKVEYQELPSDSASRQVSKGGTVVNAALKLADHFMTTEADAKADPEVQQKGNNMRSWPVCKTPKGCMLTDTSGIKSAKCEELSNGNYKITIVLKAEDNPEPAPDGGTSAPSKHGAVFSPLSRAEIDENLNGGFVSAVAKEISYNITYHDCETVLVYNPKDNHVVSLDQTTHTTIKGQGKVAGLQMVVDKQELIDYMHIYNIKY